MKKKLKDIQGDFQDSLDGWSKALWQLKDIYDKNNIMPDRFSDEDINNVTHLFIEIIGNVSIYRMIEKKTKQETGNIIAEDMGKEINKFVKKWTGVNTQKWKDQ